MAALSWACANCHKSVPLTPGNRLEEHNALGTTTRCEGSGTRIEAADRITQARVPDAPPIRRPFSGRVSG